MAAPCNLAALGMSVDNSARPASNLDRRKDATSSARRLVRCALKASLATLDRRTGYPYASLILLATEPEGTPVFLVSKLAQHTLNLVQDPRASLLIDATGGLGDPMTGARVTLLGEAKPVSSATARRRFLARHPAAQTYVDFPDFTFFGLIVSSVHYIGGFGQIVDLEGTSLRSDITQAAQLIEAEPEIIARMNEAHSEFAPLCATALAGAQPGAWRFCGLDPDGCDLVTGEVSARLDFANRINDPGAARNALAELAARARQARPS